MRIVYTGTSALTKLLNSTPHGGGPNSHDDALQGIKYSKVKSRLFDVIIGQSMLLGNNMDSRIVQA